MARLNEPSVPTESIESLKKRFMRQNRDLARVNSTQSVRIRNLENEVSHLLAENLSLREEVSHHKLEIENGRTQQIANHTSDVKTQLEARLHEITALIGSLGNPPRQKRKSQSKGRISILQTDQASGPRRWGNELDQEGRLPAILEHKSYPRQTLETQEILDIIESDEINSTESPDIGPPPVSQFVDEDPVKFDLPRKSRAQTTEEENGLDPSFSINLEHRRRRKDSGGLSESRRSSTNELGIQDSDSNSTLKLGAKRKLSVREDDEGSGAAPTNLQDLNKDSTVQDREVQTEKEPENLVADTSRKAATVKEASKHGQMTVTRRVLAPKSVNKSPKKQVRVALVDESKLDKLNKPKLPIDKERKENQRDTVKTLPVEKHVESFDTIVLAIEPQMEPETPAAMDILSPPTSQPSTTRAESRDTPPPADLGVNNEAARPSRRARGAVSYAEPNLRDKMRRPTKDLIDAVSGDVKGSRQSLSRQDDSASTTWSVKAETTADIDWKSMPTASSNTLENSPLRSKGLPLETLPSSISTHRKRRESLLQQSDSDAASTNPGNTIIALLAENRKAKAVAISERNKFDKENASAPLDGSNFKDLSQVSTTKSPNETNSETAIRRISSINRRVQSQDDGNNSDLDRPKKGDATSTRRRQSSLGLKSSSSRTDFSEREGIPNRVMKRPSSVVELPSASETESRSERISARRRSMML